MLEFVIGSHKHPWATGVLKDALGSADLTGTLYVGYPVLASLDGPVSLDGLLCCTEHGIVVFDFSHPNVIDSTLDEVREHQADLFAALFQKLYAAKVLRSSRSSLKVDIRVITVTPTAQHDVVEADLTIVTPDSLLSVVREGNCLSEELVRMVNASVERVSTLKPQNKRTEVTRHDSRGALIEKIEAEIANLDEWQKRAAVETPEGPQRIRGLAGSGKTVVLALKAAYLHAQNPDWKIAVTFHTRSLYQQFKELVRRFSFDAINDEPNWENLQILHAWGSAGHAGVYSTIAANLGLPIRDFRYARSKFGYAQAFNGVCAELLDGINAQPSAPPIFDAILIDEAQDLPREFFEISYLVSCDPHRVIWAYDELQNLTQQSMPPLRELFGFRPDGSPRVASLRTDESPRQDIILPVCYRNTPWALATAHAIGFGIYRDKGLVQFFDDPDLWLDIGYEVVDGRIAPSRHVVLRRAPNSYPSYFQDLLRSDDAVLTTVFDNMDAQAEWVAEQIRVNLSEDQLRPQDILIVLSNPLQQERHASAFMTALDRRGIPSHLAGVTSSVDLLFRPDSVALSGIYRAKGNEAAMVYVVHAEYGAESSIELIKRRNVIFTAITRSRAWVRICGIGDAMSSLAREVARVKDKDYTLDFDVPSLELQRRLRRIHRDMSASERSRLSRTQKELEELVEHVEAGDLPVDAIPDDLLERLLALRKERDSDDAS